MTVTSISEQGKSQTDFHRPRTPVRGSLMHKTERHHTGAHPTHTASQLAQQDEIATETKAKMNLKNETNDASVSENNTGNQANMNNGQSGQTSIRTGEVYAELQQFGNANNAGWKYAMKEMKQYQKSMSWGFKIKPEIDRDAMDAELYERLCAGCPNAQQYGSLRAMLENEYGLNVSDGGPSVMQMLAFLAGFQEAWTTVSSAVDHLTEGQGNEGCYAFGNTPTTPDFYSSNPCSSTSTL